MLEFLGVILGLTIFSAWMFAVLAVAMRMIENRWPWQPNPIFCWGCGRRHISGKGEKESCE